MFTKKILPLFLLASLLLAACGGSAPAEGSGLKVVASTTIVGDVVAQVGGDLIQLTVLFPPGADPHTFEPRPQDLAALSEAQVVVINGMDLEEALEPALEANVTGTIIHASEGIEVLAFEGEEHEGEEHEGEEHESEEHEGEEHHHEGGDPHTWTDPNNVIVWAQTIAAALAEADPANAKAYQANADAYVAALTELDGWIHAQVEQIPAERRKLVTDHRAFGYFVDEYGLEQAGALVGSFSTNAAPSAQELAALEDKIKEQGVPAVFVGKTVNPELSEQVAQDTGVKLVYVYTGSLSEPGGEADSYIEFMRYNVDAIVEALK
ncbi:MAG: metal ABC transporter substrate-binding protein [Chloroflexota bacterium]